MPRTTTFKEKKKDLLQENGTFLSLPYECPPRQAILPH